MKSINEQSTKNEIIDGEYLIGVEIEDQVQFIVSDALWGVRTKVMVARKIHADGSTQIASDLVPMEGVQLSESWDVRTKPSVSAARIESLEDAFRAMYDEELGATISA